MPIRSMTGYSQVKGQLSDKVAFTLSLKSVNHRFLDLHLRMPADSDALEMRLRRVLKEKLARGHVELTLSLERGSDGNFAFNRELVGGYVEAFRAAAREFGVPAEPDLNAVLRLPGALEAAALPVDGDVESILAAKLEDAVTRLNDMRVEEGRGIERELRERMQHLEQASNGVQQLRSAVLRAHVERLQARMQELLSAHVDRERILQEAAMLAERSDIQEEVVRLQTHIQHFRGLLEGGGEVGKKLDFLLQEMGREANTLLSKTSGVAGEALRITELGLSIKAEIEKAREQVQNIE